MGQMTVFFGPERRRRWSDEERLKILNQAFARGACVAEVCRRYDISSALIYTWRRKLRDAHAEPEPDDLAAPGFAAAVMIEDVEVGRRDLQPAIAIDLARGKRIRLCDGAEARWLKYLCGHSAIVRTILIRSALALGSRNALNAAKTGQLIGQAVSRKLIYPLLAPADAHLNTELVDQASRIDHAGVGRLEQWREWC